MNTIGKYLRNIRLEKQISQEELAEKVFTTRQTISNYETGKSAPDLEMIEALALNEQNELLRGSEDA